MLGLNNTSRVVYLGSKRVGPTTSSRKQLHLHNYLEQDLQSFLRPLNLSKYILLSSKYSVRDNFITPNSRCYHCCSFFMAFCFAVTYTTVLILSGDVKNVQSLLKIIFIINHVAYIIGVAFNAFLNAIRSGAHVRLIINIQRLRKSSKFIKINSKGFVIGNWLYVLSVNLFYSILSIIHIYLGDFSLTLLMCYVVLLLGDLNILFMIRIVKLLTHSITMSVLELIYVSEIIVKTEEKSKEERIYIERWSMAVSSYMDTVDCLHDYRKLNEETSLCYMCIIFLNSLTNVQLLIVNSSKTILTPIMTLMWVLKQVILLLQLTFESEKLYVTLKNNQVTFIMKISDTNYFSTRTAYKRLFRASKVASSTLRTGRVITVNATLPLTLISVIATYAVVLLQIAFL